MLICLIVCLFVCLFVCVFTCLLWCPLVWFGNLGLFACVLVVFACFFVCLLVCVCVYLCVYLCVWVSSGDPCLRNHTAKLSLIVVQFLILFEFGHVWEFATPMSFLVTHVYASFLMLWVFSEIHDVLNTENV